MCWVAASMEYNLNMLLSSLPRAAIPRPICLRCSALYVKSCVTGDIGQIRSGMPNRLLRGSSIAARCVLLITFGLLLVQWVASGDNSRNPWRL